jgi:IS30 family transposase
MDSREIFHRKRQISEYDLEKAYETSEENKRFERQNLLDELRTQLPNPADGSRVSPEQMIASLKYAALQLETDILSSYMYDNYRNSHPELCLPSASVIRKWLLTWNNALESAGLKPV